MKGTMSAGSALREAGRWTGGALVVIAAHAALVIAAHAWRPAPDAPEALEAPVVELVPMTMLEPQAVAAEAVPQEHAAERVEPDRPVEIAERAPPAEALDPEAVSPQPLRAEPAETAMAERIEAMQPEPAESAQEKQERLAAIATDTLARQVAVPLPSVSPQDIEELAPAAKPRPRKAAEMPVRKPAASPKPDKERKLSRERASEQRRKATEAADAPKRKIKEVAVKADAKASSAAAASRARQAPKVSPARWQSKVLAWLNRHKRYPAAAKRARQEGTVRLAFSIDLSGRVLGARLVQSSGNAELDRAALDMVHRASPVPAPPADLPPSSLRITVPVAFSLR